MINLRVKYGQMSLWGATVKLVIAVGKYHYMLETSKALSTRNSYINMFLLWQP